MPPVLHPSLLAADSSRRGGHAGSSGTMTTPGKTKPPDSKIVVLGRPAVGKSALVVRFITRRFIWEYDPTLECSYRHMCVVDDEQVVMDILDTAGEEDASQREGTIRWADGFVLVYSINDRESFERLSEIKQTLDDVKKTNVQCVLVGNKVDLLHERRVEKAEGQSLAQDFACAFFEISASDGGDDIPELFHELHREVRRRKMMEGKGRRRSSAQQVRHVFNRVFNKINSAS